jgi:hypothetical protein
LFFLYLTFTVNILLSWITSMDKFRSFKEKMKKASDRAERATKSEVVEEEYQDKKVSEPSIFFREEMKKASDHANKAIKSEVIEEEFQDTTVSESSVFFREELRKSTEKTIAAIKVEVFEDEYEEPVNKQQLASFREKHQKLSEKAIAAVNAELIEDEFEEAADNQQLFSFREKLQKSSEKIIAVVKSERLLKRFNKGEHTADKLEESLAVTGYHHLTKTTLLTHDVHKQHAALLAGRYIKKWNKVVQDSISVDVSKERFRFLTLLDCIEVPDPTIALKTIIKFKESLQSISDSSTGIWLLGCIEVEVVSMDLMRRYRELITTGTSTGSNEMRKLDVCELLLKRLPLIQRNLPCYLLVHFHGVVSAKSAFRFEQFYSNLKNNKRWAQAPRQIELKKFSNKFRGRQKSMEQNLTDIADYITKGGNDWMAKRAYFKYKLNFDGSANYDELLSHHTNWRKKGLLNDFHKEEGVEDPLSLTLDEISLLAQIIDGMMSLDKNRTGYLVGKV